MRNSTLRISLLGSVLLPVFLVLPVVAGAADAPPSPTMPAHWMIVSDATFHGDDLRSVGVSLGAVVRALRNTTYDVGGNRVKLNTIVAATEADADSIERALTGMKPSEFFVRSGLLIYEFVGPNGAIPDIRNARSSLTGR